MSAQHIALLFACLLVGGCYEPGVGGARLYDRMLIVGDEDAREIQSGRSGNGRPVEPELMPLFIELPNGEVHRADKIGVPILEKAFSEPYEANAERLGLDAGLPLRFG